MWRPSQNPLANPAPYKKKKIYTYIQNSLPTPLSPVPEKIWSPISTPEIPSSGGEPMSRALPQEELLLVPLWCEKALTALSASPCIDPHPLLFWSSSADPGPCLHPLHSALATALEQSHQHHSFSARKHSQMPAHQCLVGKASHALAGCSGHCSLRWARGAHQDQELGSAELAEDETSSGAGWEQHRATAHTAHQRALTKRVSLPDRWAGRVAAGVWREVTPEDCQGRKWRENEETRVPAWDAETSTFTQHRDCSYPELSVPPAGPCCLSWRKSHCRPP